MYELTESWLDRGEKLEGSITKPKMHVNKIILEFCLNKTLGI